MRRIRHFAVLFVVLVFFYSSANPSQAKGPCDDPNIRRWAQLVDNLFGPNKPSWAQVWSEAFTAGHAVTIATDIAPAAELADLRIALKHMGFTKQGSNPDFLQVETWESKTHWKNPCPGGGSPASQPATDGPPGNNGGWYALLLVVLAAALAIPFVGRQRQPA